VPLFLALLALFLLSGFSALVYQIVWLRTLALVFGVTVYAASAVLTSFMGGLALGSWLGGRLADRVRQPIRAFGFVEIGIAGSALAVPALLALAEAIYAAVHARLPDMLPLLTLSRLLCSGLVLLVPTTLMGASLPLLSRYVARTGGATASRIGILYAVNTTGAILGTALAGFVLIGDFGVAATTRIAVLINVAVGLAALVLAHRSRGEHGLLEGGAEAAAVQGRTSLQRRVLAVFGLAGFAGLALEVVWFRILVLFIPATTYAFTTMLAVVLLGIALGSAAASGRVRRSTDPARTLARVQIATGVLVVLSMAALAFTYRLGWRTSGMVQACVVAMLPATILMGATFPLGLVIWLRDAAGEVGKRVGVLYATNVCGAVLGAVAGGFVLLPLLGSRASLLLIACVYALAGCLLVTVNGRRTAVRYAAAAAVLLAATSLTLPDLYGAVLARRHGRFDRLVFRAEGVQTTATVHFQPPGQRVLYLDGLHQANDSEAMVRVHAEIGHLPMLLHPNPQRSLVVGLGGGVTAGAVASHHTTTDVVELARTVVAAAPYFSHVNMNLLQRPNVRMRVDDGRNYLLLTRERYDVLTADIIQPIHAGAGNLYSREYFSLARSVLRDGGLMLQWIGHRDEDHYHLIMRTFLDVFPHATLWSGGSLMVGSLAPLRISRSAVERQLSDADTRFALVRVGLDSFDALLARYTAGPDQMRAFVGGGPVLTDDRPMLEYHRSLEGTGRQVDVSSLRGDVSAYVVP
jgi:spermidine synthase